jgi:hypothetical protein
MLIRAVCNERHIDAFGYRALTYEDEGDKRPTAFTSATNGSRADCRLKDKLEEAEQDCRYCPDRFGEHISVESILETSKDRPSLAISKGVSNEKPLNRAHNDSKHSWHNGG